MARMPLSPAFGEGAHHRPFSLSGLAGRESLVDNLVSIKMSRCEPSNRLMPECPNVTATEVAQWVLCQRAWLLDREDASVSEQAAARMVAGEEFQAQSDAHVRHTVSIQAQAKSATRLALVAAAAFIILLAIWLYSPLRH
jgi:hypothetical protein